MKIGVMGGEGSFSEAAGREYAKKFAKTSDFSIEYLITSENVFKKLDKKEIDIGIIALENSTMGVILSSIEAMAKHIFSIEKVFAIDVPHCLIVLKGIKRSEVKQIVSQEPAILQCKNYLKKKWPKAKLKMYEDTAKAAADLASGVLPANAAVIASKNAAKVNGLVVLEDKIQDSEKNATTFIAVSK